MKNHTPEKLMSEITRAMMPFFAKHEQIDLSSPLIAPHAPDGVLRGPADRYYIEAEASLNSLQGLFKVESLNRRELTFKALAGLIGGAIGWLPVELASHNSHLGQVQTEWSVVAYYITAAIAAGMIGGMITAVEGSELRVTPQAQQRFIRGFVLCAALSLIATYFANSVFNAILVFGGAKFSTTGEMVAGSIFILFFARVIGWAIDGMLVGLGVGLSTGVGPNIVKGLLGGLAGGFVGGACFDLIGWITGGGMGARFFGESVIGLAIGLFIGLVQELTKAAWVTVEQGRLRGRQYRIEGPRASIGRAEENPVGLFGDPSVQPRHALIERRGSDYVIKNQAVQDGTFVNGNRIETVDLHDGDRINIGGYELRFHLRGTGTSQSAREQASLAADPINPAHVARRLAGANANVDGVCLIDASGQPFPLPNGAAVRVGRALDNEIVVSHSSVSRHHASLENINGTVTVKDLNSQNGTFVGNRRVTSSVPLNDGDAVRFGDAQFTFRGGH
jgi:pSer/pThr/pTyr-binding forkhead associated (FHA) protein